MTSSYVDKETMQSRASGQSLYGALTLTNPGLTPVQTELTAAAVPKNDRRAAEHPIVCLLRERGGEWLVPADIRLVPGIERVVRATKAEYVSLGQRGFIPREVFERLRHGETSEGREGNAPSRRDGKAPEDRQRVPMIGGEVRQVLLEIVQGAPLRGSDFYVIHVHHAIEGGAPPEDNFIVVNGEQARRVS